MIANALVGAVVTAVSWFVIGPAGPILGGGVAGYLETKNGPTVGALSGVIASLPIAVVVPIVGTALVFVPDALVGLGVLTAFVVFVGGTIVNAALGAIGGYLGVYTRSELISGSGGRSAR
ncbi:DUF5518 domain-containing protein [Halocatena salina]|uniref:DUF5518 domain-containing protein n=1 Tax=Halocatena salina TaxID=2934340 RepID=A0A8U0A3K3_9EURY|nr:DUF5518 domain-containing protein [Halocatena salina]UPM43672.1 DUF5518 domain-containing protein [Halocatena salina]